MGVSLGFFTFISMRLSNSELLPPACFHLATKMWTRFSCSKLFVAGLSHDTNETVLKKAFEQHGEIIEVKVICDHTSGKSKQYGFIQFTSDSAAHKSLKQMDGQLLDGRNISVQFARNG